MVNGEWLFWDFKGKTLPSAEGVTGSVYTAERAAFRQETLKTERLSLHILFIVFSLLFLRFVFILQHLAQWKTGGYTGKIVRIKYLFF